MPTVSPHSTVTRNLYCWTAGLLIASTWALIGCGSVRTISGTPIPAAVGDADHHSSKSIRQTDEEGQRLPFTTVFPRRWSNGNNGTAYEPCTAADTAILDAAGLDPSSVKDAAIADHQTARGCRWTFTNREFMSLTQIVGNSHPLEQYKLEASQSFEWRDDIYIDKRKVAIGAVADLGECTAFTQSGTAIVFTRVSNYGESPPISEICDKAIAFTRATIDQMPE